MKIIKDPIHKSYELTYLVSAGFTESEVNQIKDKVNELVKRHKGEIQSTDDWGKKDLAYVLKRGGKKHDQAIFVHQVIDFETTQVNGFEKDVRLVDEIIRHLLVVASDDSALVEEPKTTQTEEEAK